MKIVVDFDVCESNAICMAMAPDYFEVRDDDYLYLLKDDAPEAERDLLQQVVRGCPKRAITLID